QTILVDGLLKGVDLGFGGRDLGLAYLPEVARGDVADQQRNDGDDDQEFEKGEAGLSAEARRIAHVLGKRVNVPSGDCRNPVRGIRPSPSLALFPYCGQ